MSLKLAPGLTLPDDILTEALAIVARNSLAGIGRAREAARDTGVRPIVGCRLDLVEGVWLLVYPTDRSAYARLCRLLSLGKKRGGKAKCRLDWSDLVAYGDGLIAVLVPEVADDQGVVVGHVSEAVRSWRTVERVADLGVAVGREVVRLLRENPELAPRDVVYLCEYHHDGLAAAQEIEAAGHSVHHVYSRDPDERHRSKGRFWPDADAVKGCTVHSFKGWDSPAVVVGIAMEERSRRLAYASMTRVSSTAGAEMSYLSVVNADPRMADFQPTFELGAALAAGT